MILTTELASSQSSCPKPEVIEYLTTTRAETKIRKQAMPNAVATTIHPEWSSFVTTKNGEEVPAGRELAEFEFDMTDANSCYLMRATRKQAYLSRSKVGGALSIAGEATRDYQKINLAQGYRSSDTERNGLVGIIRRSCCIVSTRSSASLETEMPGLLCKWISPCLIIFTLIKSTRIKI